MSCLRPPQPSRPSGHAEIATGAVATPAAMNDKLIIEPIEVGSGRLDEFIRLPWSIYKNDAQWIPPLVLERREHLAPKTNPYFDEANVCYWLARRGNRPVGRISAQVSGSYLQLHQDATGHFGFLEAEDDNEIFAALLGTAEDWLKTQGMKRIQGPFNFSINDECGLLVDGYDTPPSLMMGHAPPYYAKRLLDAGYAKAKDLIAYTYDSSITLPKPVASLVAKIKDSGDVVLRPIDTSRYEAELEQVRQIFNDAWSGNWGFVPFSPKDFKHLGESMRPLIRKDLVCIAEVKGEPAAMAISLPNLNEAITGLNGALLPFGWAKLAWRLLGGRLKTARIPLMGVRKAYHGTPMGAALAFGVIDTVRSNLLRRGFREAELSWILEDNDAMNRLIEKMGGRAYKTYRIYEKDLP